MSHLTSITDARLKTTSFEVDAFGRVRKVTYPGGRFEEFTYGGAGRLKTRKDRKSVTTTYTYDGLGRLKTKTYDNGAPGVTFTYDEGPVDHKGRLTTAANVSDMLTWEYNLAGQVLNERSAFNTTTTGVIYDYYLDGSRKTVTLNNGVVGYDYFDDGQLHHVTWRPDADPDTYSFTFDPDAAHRRRSLAYPNGAVTTYTPDLLSRLANVKTMVGSNPITEWAYTYNAMGNRTLKRDQEGTGVEYGDDVLDRLTWVATPCEDEFCNPATLETYDYDAVGNRLSSTWPPVSRTYSDRNELLSVGGVGGTSFTYDLNGNLETKVEGSDSWTYVWSVENELMRVCKNVSPCTDTSATARFKYDALGRRVQKVAGVTRNFTYDGEDVLRERIPQVKNYRYVHGPGIDEPLAVQDMSLQGDTGLSYYHADALGSIVSMTSPAGAITSTRSYSAFGWQNSTVPGYAFTGREWDPETSLYYYRARYYDPTIGRFLSEDPIRWAGGMNLYAYVGDDPLNRFDPIGLQAAMSLSQRVARGQLSLHLRPPDYMSLMCQYVFGQFGFEWATDTPGYMSGGAGLPKGCGCSLLGNWILQTSPPTAEEKIKFMTGEARSGMVAYGVAGGVAYVPGAGYAAQAGLGTPGWGVGWTYTPTRRRCETCEPPGGWANYRFGE